MNRSLWAVLLAAVIAASGTFVSRLHGGSSVPPKKIFLIVLDTVRAGYLTPYGGPAYATPALQQFSKSAVVFERVISPGAWTLPAVASLFTSTYVQDHKITEFKFHPHQYGDTKPQLISKLPEGIATIGTLLSEAGFKGFSSSENSWLHPVTGLRRGFAKVKDFVKNDRKLPTFTQALRWSREWAGRSFIHLHLMAAHGPYRCSPDELMELKPFFDALDRPITAEESAHGKPRYMNEVPGWVTAELTGTVAYWRACYTAGIRRTDGQLGNFLETLRRDPDWDRTMVIITADHGEEILDHGGWEHGNKLNFHTTDVPLFIRFPGDRYGGERVHETVSLVDVLPTVLDVVHRRDLLPSYARGRSLLPSILFPERKAQPVPVFSAGVRYAPEAQAAILGRYRLILNAAKGSFPQFYDDEVDPREENLNLLHPAIPDLLAAFAGLSSRAQPHSPEAQLTEMDGEAVERLHTLGYIR